MKSIRIRREEAETEQVSDSNHPISAMEDFLRSLELRGLSPATVRTRRDGLKPFCRFLGDANVHRIQDLSAEALLRYAAEVRAAGLSESTIQVYLTSLRT